MIPTLDTLLALIAIITFTLILLLSPAAIELIKPMDAGPRLISDNSTQTGLRILNRIFNLDEELEQKNQSTLNFAIFLPNIEA